MKKFKLRDYQADDLKRINKEIKAGHKRVLYSLMTAGGKTVVLHEQVSRWLHKNLRGCVLVHTRALLNQTCAVFSDIPHGIIAGGIKSDPDKKLQICMVQSLARRGGKAFDFIVVDEAHHATASTWAKILADSPDAIIFGVTATPFRHDNRGLGQAGFTTLVEGPEVSWLTEQGFLSPVEYYAPTDIDMTGVKKVGGDYEKKESSRRANKPTITGSAVEHYKRHANGQRALVFCADIKHVLSVTKKFKKAGLNAAFIYGKMTTDEREDVLLQFAESKDMILVSCELIGEGLDVPAVACVILLRPTASLVRFIQQVGRGLRVVEGKKHVVVLDHVGNIRLGHPHVRRVVDLNGVEKKAKSLDENSPKSYLRTCPKCKRVETADVLKCSTCGHKFKAVVRGNISNIDGSLRLIDGSFVSILPLYTSRSGGHKSYGTRINNHYIHLGSDLEIARSAINKLTYEHDAVNFMGTKDCAASLARRVIHELGVDVAKINSQPGKRGLLFYYVSVGGHSYFLGSEPKNANRLRDEMVKLYTESDYVWPAHDFILEFLKKKRKGDEVFRVNKFKKQFFCCINGKPVSLGTEQEFANHLSDSLRQYYFANDQSWPDDDTVSFMVRKFRFEGRHLLKSKTSRGKFNLATRAARKGNGGAEFYFSIGTRSVYLGRSVQVAESAREYLLKFYESNNYEWPPKSEVRTLVKKALEHAKSTIE